MELIIEGDKSWVKRNKILERRGFGVKKGERIILDPVEVVYLFIKSNAKVILEGRRCSFKEVFEWAKNKKENFMCQYFVYEDLRDRGYRVKVSSDFLIANHVFYPISEGETIRIPELSKKSENLDHIVLAIVDEESEITYYKAYKIDPIGKQEENFIKIDGYLALDRVLTQNTEIFARFFYGSE